MGVSEGARSAALDREVRRAGFGSLYDAHVAEVYRFVHRRCRDRAAAEDITQDVFLTAVRTVEDPAEINTGWLITVARNRLMDLVRREGRYADKLRLIANAVAGGGDHSSSVVERERVRAALEHLSVEHRVVLCLHYLDGLTVAAMATELGGSVKAVESLITRARRRLVAELEATDG